MQGEQCVVQCHEGQGAGSGFVTEREAAETCQYLQRGGGDEAGLKYGGCISTTNWTDKRVYKERLTFILDVAQLCNRLVHVIQQVASGRLYPSLPQCKEVAKDILVKKN